jgi:GT2 family glycosyltransferase
MRAHAVLSILIPVSSRTDLLVECLASLQRHLPDDLRSETIVVLNEIDGACAAALESRFPRVRFLRSPVNLGMAGSANRARRAASGRFLVTLHDDAVIEPGWAETLLAAAHRYPRAGAIGSKVLFTDGQLQSAGAILWQSGGTTPPWSGPAPDPAELTTCRAVDYCGTCSLLIPAAVFDAVGGFDETIYPGYFVDVDFGLAVRSRGYYVVCEPRSVIRHHRHASSGELLRTVAYARNREYVLRKWTTAIALHQPPPGPGQQTGAFAVALRRAAEFARSCEAGSAVTIPPDVRGGAASEAAGGDDIERHYRLSRQLQDAVIASLEEAIACRDHALARYRRMKVTRLYANMLRQRQAISSAIRRWLWGRSRRRGGGGSGSPEPAPPASAAADRIRTGSAQRSATPPRASDRSRSRPADPRDRTPPRHH